MYGWIEVSRDEDEMGCDGVADVTAGGGGGGKGWCASEI